MKLFKGWMQLLAVFVVCAFTLTGCGGGGGSSVTPGGGGTVAAPAAPATVTATAGNGQVTVAWSQVTGATGYNIYWSTTPGVTTSNGTKLPATSNPQLQAGRANGTTYYYVVTAVNAGGESAPSPQASATPVQPFVATGSLTVARAAHSSTLLNNGSVLVAGGFNSTGTPLKSAEAYNPSTGTFATTGSMGTARYFYGASLLDTGNAGDNVLFSGGLVDNPDGTATYLDSAELYNPATGTFTASAGTMIMARDGHTSTWLPSAHMVLITGGVNSDGVTTNTAELYNPATDSFIPTVNNMSFSRVNHTATWIPSLGKVLITGGTNAAGTTLDTAELFDPNTGKFSIAGQMTSARQGHVAILLGNGTVLLVSGGDASNTLLKTAEIFDPASFTFNSVGSLNSFRDFFSATLLPNGKVLIAGGDSETLATATSEIYDPTSASFTVAGNLLTAREDHAATLLKNGTVLLSGGAKNVENSTVINSAELF